MKSFKASKPFILYSPKVGKSGRKREGNSCAYVVMCQFILDKIPNFG